MISQVSDRDSTLQNIRRLFPFLVPYRFLVVVRLLSTMIKAASDIVLVYLINLLVDSSLSGQTEELKKSIYYMVYLVIIGIAANYLETYSSGRFTSYSIRDMKDRFSSHINKLPVSYIEAKHSGELISRLTNGINTIENFFKNDLVGILFYILRTLACIIVMLFLNWQLTLFIMIILPLIAFLTGFISRPLTAYSERVQQRLGTMNMIIQDTIHGIQIIKSYNLSKALIDKFGLNLKKLLNESLEMEKRYAIVSAVSVLAKTVPFLVFFLLGSYFVIQDRFTAGGLVAFAQLITYLVQGLGALPHHISQFKMAAGVTHHLFEVLDEKVEHTGGKDHEILESSPAIEFSQVSFSYDNKVNVLDNISFILPQGKTIAFVGSSGSGKSTIFKLIAGFYYPHKGDIGLFDEKLTEWELDAARSKIAMVSQETYLYPYTIAENIAGGNHDADMEEIIRAAKMANIHNMIASLPRGYDTLVGEGGVNFSGGEKQRISIARAIMKNAPILLLDEPTSALDAESEKLIQESIKNLMKDKTVLVAAHRLSTIIESDEIIVLDHGAIVEKGTHEELLHSQGAYYRLYNKDFHSQGASRSVYEGSET